MNLVAMLAPTLVILCLSLDPALRNCPGRWEDIKSREKRSNSSWMRRSQGQLQPLGWGRGEKGENATPTTFAEKEKMISNSIFLSLSAHPLALFYLVNRRPTCYSQL